MLLTGVVLAVNVFYATKLRKTLSNATPDHFIVSLILFPTLSIEQILAWVYGKNPFFSWLFTGGS